MNSFFKSHDVRHLTADGASYVLAAGTTDVNSGAVSVANFRSIAFLVVLGAMAASSSVDLKVQGSDDGSSWSDLEGTAFTQAGATDDDKMLGVEIEEAQYAQYRVAITRGDGGNATVETVLAILHKGRVKAVEQGTGAGQFVADPEHHLSPGAGTA
jgi:hypothetical protein